MYEERKESFSVRSLILQILFVVLTVFLLLWLFPTKNYVKDYANDAFTEKLQPLYNQIYNQNITTMKETAINYFTNDRLPSKVGESVTITLKEMQDKKLVLDLIDSNNKKCDVEKSSVKVEKLDNEYLMTVKLECSDASNYIEVHLGCYDYCKASGVCEKKETPVIKPTNPTKPVISEKKYQYEYEKITDGKWGDFGEWSQWSKDTITKTEENKSTDTKENTSYTTPTTNGNSNESKPTTPPASNPPTTSTNTDSKKPTQTIDRITQEEYDDEIESYLNDIMKIKPNLKYVYEKRGQVFYPYRTEEIKIAVGKVSFGTIYYYVEKFVEGNQEKFKYYIDWAGN